MRESKYVAFLFIFFGVFGFSVVFAQTPPSNTSLGISEVDQSRLTEAYHTEFPDRDSDYVSFMVDSAISGDSVSQWRVGYFFETIDEFEKARFWYSHAANQKNLDGILDHARFRIAGKGGETDFSGAVSDLMLIANQKSDRSASGFLLEFNAIERLYKLDLSIPKLYWLEYYADRGINGKKYHKSVKMFSEQYDDVALAYVNKIDDYDYYIFGEDSTQDNLLAAARYYFIKAGNIEQIIDINSKLVNKKPKSKVLSPELYSSCKDIFSHRFDDSKLFETTQREIFLNPGKSLEISKNYNETQLKRYAIDNGEAFSFNFLNISLASLLELYLSIVFDLEAEEHSNVVIDESIQEIDVSIHALNKSPSYLFNLLLEKFGIDVTCKKRSIEFKVSNKRQAKSIQLVTGAMITSWEGDFEIRNGQLFGEGEIIFDSGLRFKGGVSHSMPNGPGELIDGEQFIVQSNFFSNGVAMGRGQMIEQGEVVYIGGFKYGNFEGSGQAFILDQRYKGEYKDGFPHGKGKEEIVRHKEEAKSYYYPLDFEVGIFYSFEGAFVDGEKHGEGVCYVNNNNQGERFTCRFYRDNLIEVNEVSLLPPGFVFGTHFENLR
ncbi:MORN repeat-containing protein [Aurantivibrio infirmus]